jgi:uncharacterized protein (TIRG00374 family)
MIWLKRAFALAALGVVLYLFWPLLEDIQDAVGLFRRANWTWLFVAILLQLISYSFLTWLNYLALQPFSGKIRFRRLAAILTSMAFIEVAIPSAGASGVAMRARMLQKHGQYTLEASLFSLVVETLYEGVIVASVAFAGLLYLLQIGGMSGADIGGLAAAGICIGGLVWGSWRIIQHEQRSRQLLSRFIRFWNRVLGKIRPIEIDHFEQRLELFHAGLAKFRTAPRWKFWLAAFGKVVFDVATLGACFYLFNHAISSETLLVGYGLVLLLSGLAALPGGLGLADVSLPVIFAQLGVIGSVALAAGLMYRLIAFWAVRFLGFVSWQFLERKS